MKISSTILIAVLSLGAGLLLGPRLFKTSLPSPASTTPNHSVKTAERPQLITSPEASSFADLPTVTLLSSSFAESAEYESIQQLMAALVRHKPETSKDFATYFKSITFQKKHLPHWRLFFSSWGRFDAPAAIAFVQSQFSQNPVRLTFIHTILKSWHGEDPVEALAQSGSLLLIGENPHHELALEHLRQLMTTNPELALKQMVMLSDPEAVMTMAGEELQRLAQTDIQGALSQLNGTEGEAKSYLTGQLLSTWSEKDPKAAVNWLQKNGFPQISPGDLQQLVANYVKLDPSAAFQWLNTLPDSHFNEELLGSSARAWAEKDPSGIQSWLKEHQPTAESDPVVIALAQSLRKQNPAQALTAASSLIHDPGKSQETFFEIAMEWQKAEPAQFSNWLENTNLIKPTHKQRLLAHEFHGEATTPQPAQTANPVPLNDGRNFE